MSGRLDPRLNVDWAYISRSENGRGPTRCENCVNDQTKSLPW